MLRTLLHRPIAVTMTLIAIVVLGVLALGRIPVSLMPDIDVPRIVVQMSSQGSSAREIEQRIVTPMRQQLSQVAGLQNIESMSRTDAGTVTLTFSPGSDMSLLFIEVNEKIDRAMGSMPKDMERPRVMKIGALDIPAFYVDVTGGKPEQTSRLVRNVISKRMEQLPEVAMVDYSGLVGSQITLMPDVAQMQSLGISNADIEKAVSNNNIVLEALSVREGIYRYSIHFDSQILSVQDIENIYLRHEGRLLQLKDVCRVEEHAAERKGIVMSDGKDAITMAVIKQSDAQMADLQQSIWELMEHLAKDYPSLHFAITRDQTQLLSYSMQNLEWDLVVGIVMASMVLFVFIGGWRVPLLVVISIPLSLVLTLLCFYLMGISLNVISLSGLILGVGMIVDNAIIVADNISQRGTADDADIASAVREVFMPMLSSVLTTCSVFIPLIFLSGTAGALFYDQAMGISIALFCSLAVAALVVPVYYLLFCRTVVQKDNRLNKLFTRYYELGMGYTLRHPRTMTFGFSASLLLIIVLFPFLRKERMPETPHDDALISVDWNAGITPEESRRRVGEALGAAQQYVTASTAMVGGQDFMLSHTKNITGSEAIIYIKCLSDRELATATHVIGQHVASHYPEAHTEAGLAANIFDMVFSTGEPDLRIRLQRREGGRPDVELTRQLTDSLRRHYPELGVQPVATEAYLRYTTDAEQMAYYKVTYRQLYSRLRELLGTSSIYDINSGGESVPVIIGTESRDASVLLSNTILNQDGVDVPLSYLVREAHGEDYKHLMAGDDGEFSAIDIEHASDSEARAVMDYVSSLTDSGSLQQLKASFSGGYFSSRSMVWELAMVLVVAVLLLYFILAAQFESILQPVIILVEIVVDVALVLLALFMAGESLNVMSMIGIVVMCGIVINDSILKVDTINRIYRSGTPLLKAIIVAGHRRLKPIIMTSLTTILAIVPFLQRGDMGSALQFPLSFTIIVGMLAGTLVSLFFVPWVYYVLYRKRS